MNYSSLDEAYLALERMRKERETALTKEEKDKLDMDIAYLRHEIRSASSEEVLYARWGDSDFDEPDDSDGFCDPDGPYDFDEFAGDGDGGCL
ncbi:MAG: hypothetical protein PHW53_03110 [Patescibacteria group bacterium]|nr:hypothetical protein [Patescibacteria group bacterium]